MNADRNPRASQLRKGVLELAVLAMLRDGERYGSQLVDELSERPGLSVSAGTIYPLLSRLRQGGMVTTTWHESPVGPPRKHYALTASGHRALDAMTETWASLVRDMDAILREDGR